jgi:hypothetical protein
MVTGCVTDQSPRTVASTKRYVGPTDPLDVVLAKINERAARVPTLIASGKFTGNLGAKRGELRYLNGQVDLAHAKPDSVRLKLTKDLAGQLFDTGTDGKQFWLILDQDGGTCWHGRVRATGEPPARELPIRPELLLDILGVASYSVDLTAEPAPTMRFNPDYDAYMLTWHAKQGDRFRVLREIWFDRATLRPRLVMLYDPDGRIVVRAKLDDYQPVSAGGGEPTSGEMARRFDIRFPETDSNLVITLDSVRDKRNGAPNRITFAFNPQRSGARRVIDLDEPAESQTPARPR